MNYQYRIIDAGGYFSRFELQRKAKGEPYWHTLACFLSMAEASACKLRYEAEP